MVQVYPLLARGSPVVLKNVASSQETRREEQYPIAYMVSVVKIEPNFRGLLTCRGSNDMQTM